MKPCLKTTTKIHPSRIYKAKPTGPLTALRGSALVTQPLSGCPLAVEMSQLEVQCRTHGDCLGERAEKAGFCLRSQTLPFPQANFIGLIQKGSQESPQVEALVRTKTLLKRGTRCTPVSQGSSNYAPTNLLSGKQDERERLSLKFFVLLFVFIWGMPFLISTRYVKATKAT